MCGCVCVHVNAHYLCVCLHVSLCVQSRYPFTSDQPIPECDWEAYLRETASMIVEEQTPKRYTEPANTHPKPCWKKKEHLIIVV